MERHAKHANTRLSVVSSHHRGEEVLTSDRGRTVNPHLVSLLQPDSVEAERYRRLRHVVEQKAQSDQTNVIAITSAVAGDGKTLTSINLAAALAQDQQASVLLVELDLRQPFTNVKDYLGIKKLYSKGLVDRVLDDKLSIEQVVYYIADFNLYVMPSGTKASSAYDILNSPKLGKLLDEAKHRYDYVIVDTAPIAFLPDSQLISPWVDGFMIVVGAGNTPKDMLEESLNVMDPDKVLGLVFNGYSAGNEKKFGYY
ncbi:MAG: CpsD/CapB family tyrosine-protein kinase [Pseudohongiellaceae bacterium]